MRKFIRCVSFVLCVIMVLQPGTMAVAALETASSSDSALLHQSTDSKTGITTQVSKYEGNIFYIIHSSSFVYCAEISQSGNMVFSYTMSGNRIAESPICSVENVYSMLNISAQNDTDYFSLLNQGIISNLSSFTPAKVIYCTDNTEELVSTNAGFSSLSAAINHLYTADYTNKYIGPGSRSYNGTTYSYKCTESQNRSNSTIQSKQFISDTAITTIISWLVLGEWAWMGLLASIVVNVVITVLKEGVRYTLNTFTAQKTDVTVVRTRIVTRSGSSDTLYWAGWTRKTYFFKGENGWTYDSDPHYNVKHSDYDDLTTLFDKAHANYIDTLIG